MKMYKRMAKPISYAPKKRNRKDVFYIPIHYTGNSNDTAKNNADYYATGNTRLAGAHFFVDKLGNTARSIPMNRTAWAVGGAKYADCKATGGGKYYSKCTNYNSVSIELCGCTEAEPYTKEQAAAVKRLIKYIRKCCPNANTVIRHFDVNGKHCPAPMMNRKIWQKFKKDIGEI